MTVYVDDMKLHLDRGNTNWCNMWADSLHELLGMAAKIGLRAWWIQTNHASFDYFELSASKRALAVHHGAVYKSLAQWAKEKKEQAIP